MFKKILYPTDFSDTSARVIDYINELKGSGLETVIVLHVIDSRKLNCFEEEVLSAGQTPPEFEESYKKHVTEKSDRELGAVEEKLTGMGFHVETRLVTGIPFNEILKVEEDESVSATIIGSHGKSNIEEMLLGSVSEKVIRKSKKPVIVIKR